MTSSLLSSDSDTCRTIAGIDIGTNTIRLLIAQAQSGTRLIAMHSDQVMTRLGKGLHDNGALQTSSMDHTIRTLQHWRRALIRHGITQPVVVATSAVRDATNRETFLQRVQTDVGFEVEVLSGEEEARRTFLGVAAGLPTPCTNSLIIDIGGGSTEMIAVKDGHPHHLLSTDLGIVQITDRFLQADPIPDDAINAARQFILDRLDTVKAKLGNTRDTMLIGTAGTITTLAAMNQDLASYNPSRVHHHRLSITTIQRIGEICRTKTLAERRTMVGLEPERADVIVAGILILQLIMEKLRGSTLTVSEYGLREGILVDRIQKTIGTPVALALFDGRHA